MGNKKTINPSLHQLQKRIKSGFTLIEILIVVGVLAALGTVAVLLLDPATRLAASRDSNRFTSLQSVNQALSLIKIGNPSVSFGLGNTVYLSLPDSSPVCSSWDLPPLPETWSYACQTEANYRKVDGSGWTPVNLASSSLGTSSSVAPVDPRNNENNYFYYVFNPSTSSYELGTAMETDKNKVIASSDGGDNSDMWEIGSGLSLYPGSSGFFAVTNDASQAVRNENNFLSYATAASVGQVAFFIGSSQITGSNDFFWNDSTNKLTVAGIIESTGLKLTTSPSNGYVLTSDASGVGTWQQASGSPAGAVMFYAGSSAPSGYFLCDGSAVSRITYSALFTAISTTYGAGDGSTTFNLPNMKGKNPIGRDAAQTEFDALGETGGEKTHTLTTNEMPAHTHALTNRGTNTPGGSKTYKTDTAQVVAGDDVTSSVGGGAAHNVLDPYITLNCLIKT